MSVIVVTGANRGMGRACVERLRGRADHLIAVDLDVADLEGVDGVVADISDPEAVAGLADRVAERGSFRSLIHVAGVSPTMGDARRMLEINLVGTQLLLDAFEPLVEAGSSAVCFASMSAYQLTLGPIDPELDALLEDPLADGFLDAASSRFDDSGLAYAWSKRGVIRAVGRAAVRWGRRGGRVVSVSPGLIDTGMGRQEFESQPMMQTILDNTPLGRLGRPDELAAVVSFLISDEASFLTGVDVLVDGGAVEGFRTLLKGTA